MAAPELHVVSAGSFALALCDRLELEVVAALKHKESCSVALTGGSVGDALFPELLQRQAGTRDNEKSFPDWSLVQIFWGDERAVPRQDPLSNFKQAHDLWLGKSTVPPANIHPMDPIAGELQSCARKYEAVLRHSSASASGLDVLLLGVGPDGHVCSLFPGHPVLNEATHWVRGVSDSPKPPAERLTLTLPAIFASRTVIVAASGAGKAAAVAQARSGQSASPLAQVLQGSERVVLVLDQSAAGEASAR